MRLAYLGYIALLFSIQLGLIVCMFHFDRRWLHPLVALAHVIPFIVGITLFYPAPAFATTRPLARIIGLVLIFGIGSAAFFWPSMFVVFTCEMAFGGHHW